MGIGRTFVAFDDKDEVVGYFTLATAQVVYEDIPDEYRGKLPKYTIPSLRTEDVAIHTMVFHKWEICGIISERNKKELYHGKN